MEWIHSIALYFIEDPLRIVTVVGGSGGLAYWYDRIRNRPRICVRLTSLNKNEIHFEVENTTTGPNSLKHVVEGSAYSFLRERHSFVLEIQEKDRAIPPFSPRQFTARPRIGRDLPEDLHFLFFMTFSFGPAQGRVKRLRFHDARTKQLPLPIFVIRFLMFFIRGQVRFERAWRSFRNKTPARPTKYAHLEVYFYCPRCGTLHNAPDGFDNTPHANALSKLEFQCAESGEKVACRKDELIVRAKTAT